MTPIQRRQLLLAVVERAKVPALPQLQTTD